MAIASPTSVPGWWVPAATDRPSGGLRQHPFGTIKRWMDQGYFLMRGKKKVSTEMSLTVLAYNLRRVINLLGVKALIEVLA